MNMGGIEVAEAKRKKGPKTLDHLELHPKLGGGHIVKHVYSGYEHEPKEYKFNESGKGAGGEHITAHLEKHAGLPPMEGREGAGSETEEEIEA
jgi:hypothetical protein